MSVPELKVVLVGPLPPPHGGISVHVAAARRLLEGIGVPCEVVEIGGPGPSRGSSRAILGALARLRRLARSGWLLHVHANGHGGKSWLSAILSGTAARASPGRVLTVHSGMAPSFLAGSTVGRALARMALLGFDRVVCVNGEIAAAIQALGMDATRVDVAPARLPEAPAEAALPRGLEPWLSRHHPVIATVLAFRPEYAFGTLVEALELLKASHPDLGCLVIGGGDGEAGARESLRQRHLEEWVWLTGDVPHDACLAMMARSHLFVRATLADGDAVSVREALSLGLPVVASDAGTRPDGVALVPPGDAPALARAAESAVGRGEPGAWRLEAPDPEPLRRLLRIYERAADHGGRRAPALPREPRAGRAPASWRES